MIAPSTCDEMVNVKSAFPNSLPTTACSHCRTTCGLKSEWNVSRTFPRTNYNISMGAGVICFRTPLQTYKLLLTGSQWVKAWTSMNPQSWVGSEAIIAFIVPLRAA